MRAKLSIFLQWNINIFIVQKIFWRNARQYVIILGKLYFFINRKEKQKIMESIESAFAGFKKSLTRSFDLEGEFEE